MLYSKELSLWKKKAEIIFSAPGVTLSLHHLTFLPLDFCLTKGFWGWQDGSTVKNIVCYEGLMWWLTINCL